MTKELYQVWFHVTIEPSQADWDWAIRSGEYPRPSNGSSSYIVLGETEEQAYKKAMEYWQEHHERRAQISSQNIRCLEPLKGISLEDRMKLLELHFPIIK